MTSLQPGDVVWTTAFALHGSDLLTATAQIGYEPHEVIVDAGERLTVRSLTTREYRVVRRNELDMRATA